MQATPQEHLYPVLGGATADCQRAARQVAVRVRASADCTLELLLTRVFVKPPVPSLLMVSSELRTVLAERYGSDASAVDYLDQLRHLRERPTTH